MSCENPNRFIQICVDGAPVGTGNPLPTSGGGGPGSNVLVTDIEDGAGDSVMDAANNAVRVNIVAGAGSGGTAMTDEAAFTEGATSFTPVGGVFNDALATPPAAGQAAAARITSDRALHSNLRNATGTEIGTAAAPVRTDPTGTTAQPITDNAGSITVDAPAATPVPVGVTDTSNTLVKPGDAVNNAVRVNVVAGGGGGAVTIADGADVALGATADAAASSDTGTFSLIALFKRLLGKFTTQFPAALVGGRFDVNIGAASATVPVSASSLPLPTGAATEATLATRLSESDFDAKVGSLTETAPATDTASSGLNGRLQRIAQRLTSLIALLPAALVNGRLDVNVGSTTPVTGTVSSGSGTIAAPAASQPIFAAPGTTRLWVEIVNVSDETLWVNWNGVAATQDQPSYPLLGNGLGILRFSAEGGGFVPQTAINIIGATAAKSFSAYQVLA